jgi:uncharacterized protein
MESDPQRKRAEVSAVAMDPEHKVPVVLLKPEDDDRFIPIWVGMNEASAILVALEGAETKRPMTHDLMIDTLTRCGVKVTQVELCDLEDGTYFAEIRVMHAGRVLRIDSRPSDAIAVALRAEAPVFIHERVLERVQFVDDPLAASDDESADLAGDDEAPQSDDEMRQMLEDMDPDDFKYRM